MGMGNILTTHGEEVGSMLISCPLISHILPVTQRESSTNNSRIMPSPSLFKVLVLTFFCAYIGVACWGVTSIREGLEKRNTANYDSYSVEFYDMDDK